MTLADKHGFLFRKIAPDHEQILAFALQHFIEHHLPLDSPIRGSSWYAIVRDEPDGERIYGVFGLAPSYAGAEVTDLYTVHGRLGVLASYAALERLKNDADASGMPLVTATPTNNEAMIRAHKRIFGDKDEPVLMVYRYVPTMTEVSEQTVARGTIDEAAHEREGVLS